MDSRHDVMCYKIVTSGQVNVDKIEFPRISEAVRQVIQESKLESMRVLLGGNWQNAARRLARQYWGVKEE